MQITQASFRAPYLQSKWPSPIAPCLLRSTGGCSTALHRHSETALSARLAPQPHIPQQDSCIHRGALQVCGFGLNRQSKNFAIAHTHQHGKPKQISMHVPNFDPPRGDGKASNDNAGTGVSCCSCTRVSHMRVCCMAMSVAYWGCMHAIDINSVSV